MRNLKFGIELEVATKKSQRQVVQALRDHGIDAVADRYGSQVNHNQWKVQYDGSLNSGWEIVSPPITDTEDLETVMFVLRKVIKAQGSPLTGLHIHHDINDFNLEQIKNLYSLYNKYEDNAIKSILRKQRIGNYYCKPISQVVNNVQESNTIEEFKRSSNSRYHTLNNKAYIKYGTIEFRHHHGTTDVNEVMTWLHLTHKIVEAAQNGIDGNTSLQATTYEEALEELFEEIGVEDEKIMRLARGRRRAIAKADGRSERFA